MEGITKKIYAGYMIQRNILLWRTFLLHLELLPSSLETMEQVNMNGDRRIICSTIHLRHITIVLDWKELRNYTKRSRYSKLNRGKKTLFGGVFMKNHDVLFDKSNKRIGFIRSNCSAEYSLDSYPKNTHSGKNFQKNFS